MKIFENIYFRRILGFIWHLVGFLFCWWLAFEIRFDFNLSGPYHDVFERSAWVPVAVLSGCILLFRLYRGLWRFFTFRDCVVTGIAFLVGSVGIAMVIYFQLGFNFHNFPRSIIIINYLLVLAWEIGGRGGVRLIKENSMRWQSRKLSEGKAIVLVGDTEECDALIRSLSRQAGRIVAIINGEGRHRGGTLRGIPIVGDLSAVGDVVKERSADVVVILPPHTSPGKVRAIVDSVTLARVSCEYRVVPSIDDIAGGRVDVNQFRKVKIEDLLNREPCNIDVEKLRESVRGKRLLVTGAGGSIGSEICRQIIQLDPSSLTLFEISEFLLFEIERELISSGKDVRIIAVTGDVKRTDHVRKAIEITNGIDIIYHAAAYKHVDMVERNPFACIENNVVGTAVVAGVAEDLDVSQFVLISSDKAVRPTSLMGASKRLAERCIIERPVGRTQFKAVRFGNVLGSSGSVVPIFKQQIASGGPVTVTSKDVTRFFMTIPEAVELVLAAGGIDEDRRIFVLEMGDAVKIDLLARRMIELSGFVPDVDIPIIYTGLKRGEKEYEELLTDDENVVRTDLDRIWVVKPEASTDVDPVDIGRLLELIDEGDAESLRGAVASLIPDSRLYKGVRGMDV